MKKKFNFAQEVTKAIQALGAKETGAYGWQLDTRAGLLELHPYEDWVACRFDDVERAKATVYFGALNPYSGKWNWHFVKPDAVDVEYFVSQVSRLLERQVVKA